MPFEKGKRKTGGRKKGSRNKGGEADVLKKMIGEILVDDYESVKAMLSGCIKSKNATEKKLLVDLIVKAFGVDKPDVKEKGGKEYRVTIVNYSDLEPKEEPK